MRKNILIFIILIGYIKIFPQTNNLSSFYQNMPTAPTSTTFLRYGDIQNSEFTGTNSTNIPLYKIKTGNIELPISLDYIAGNGIRVGDEGSSVGLGWNIGLPAIVQTIYGIDDFDFEDEFVKEKIKILLHYQPETPWGLLNYNQKYLESLNKNIPSGYINQPQIGKYTYYYSSRRTVPIGGSFITLNNGTEQDATADIFTLNLFGTKIQFFISNHQYLDEINSIPYFECLTKGYKVEFNKNLFLFTVTAPDGVSYIFGKAEKTRLYQTLNRNFVLTKIIDKNNNSITLAYDEYSGIDFVTEPKRLNYTRGKNSTFFPNCEGIPIADGTNNMYYSSSKARPINIMNSDPFASAEAGHYAQSQNNFQQSSSNFLFVSKISWNDGELDFNYTTREDKPTAKLSSVTLKNITNQNVKVFELIYEYTIANPNYSFFSTNMDLMRMNKRLFLQKLVINNIDEFQFEYFNKEALPRKDSYAVDYWGYFNGGIDNKSYFINPLDFNGGIMSSLPITDVNNNKKIADITYVTSGLIKKIIYPTKGYSLFDYELNSANNLIEKSSIQFGKGVRLKSQTTHNINRNLVNKVDFEYENGYCTNPLSFIQEFSQTYPTGVGTNVDWSTYSIVSMNSTNNYSSSILSSGDYVGYEKVVSKKVDNGLSNGKSISKYSINPDVYYKFWPYQMPINIPSTKALGIDNGKLLSQTLFDQSNVRIKEVINNYNTTYSNVSYSTIFSSVSERLYMCTQTINSGGGGNQPRPDVGRPNELHIVSHFPIYSKESLLSSTKTIDYLGGKELVTNISYNYNNLNLLQTKVTNTISGDNITENFRYTNELGPFMLKNILSNPLENSIAKNNKLISKEITGYNGALHMNPLSLSSLRLDNSSLSEVKILFDQYDNRGNLTQYSKNAGVSTTIIWDYNKNNPIAKIEGGKISDLPQGLITDIVNATHYGSTSYSENTLLNKLDIFRASLPNFYITTYTFRPLIGVSTITPPSGIREVYKYDSANRIQSVVDMNGNILKEYSYNYAPTRHYNPLMSQTFTRNNCSTNFLGGDYKYVVAEGKYFSLINIEDAIQKAQNDINTNGQNTANNYGDCRPAISCPISMSFSGYGIGVETDTNYKITISFSTGSNSTNLQWSTGVKIGNIQGICRPLVDYNSYNGQMYYTIKTNGDILIRSHNGNYPNNTNYSNLLFYFPKH